MLRKFDCRGSAQWVHPLLHRHNGEHITGICPVCSQDVRLTREGRLYIHRKAVRRAPGLHPGPPADTGTPDK